MSLTPAQTALWANQVQRDCLIEAGEDVEAGLAAAEFILSQSSPDDTTLLDIALGNFDPNQPRRPKGDPEGGEWVTVGGYAHSSGQMHVGGFHAKVTKDGTIVSGKLKGRKIQDVKKHFDALPDEHKGKFTDGLHDSLQSLKPSSNNKQETKTDYDKKAPHENVVQYPHDKLVEHSTGSDVASEIRKGGFKTSETVGGGRKALGAVYFAAPGSFGTDPYARNKKGDIYEGQKAAKISVNLKGLRLINLNHETENPEELPDDASVYERFLAKHDNAKKYHTAMVAGDLSVLPKGVDGSISYNANGEIAEVVLSKETANRLLKEQNTSLSIDAVFAHDIHNRAAQGILNRSLQAAKGLSAAARRDLTAAIKSDSGKAILTFIDKYRLQLAKLLTTTQLAAVLEGAREVADKVPTLATFPGAVAPPPTLEPQQAVALVERLERTRDAVKRAEIIADLPPEQQEYARQAIIAKEAYSGLPSPSFTPPAPPAGSGAPEDVHLPTIDEAVKSLAERNVMDRQRYDALDAAARAKAFTVANVSAQETLAKIRDSLAENVEKGTDYETWKGQVLQDVDSGTFMSDAHQETVFRTNIQTAFSDGQETVLSNPLVRSGFPYRSYDAIHDDRARENHLALENLGIQGTNIYRADDPVFQLFRPPWDYNDRCGSTPKTVRQAAEAGIAEAQEWLRTGVEPVTKTFVPMPPFQPPPGFQRAVASVPMSVRLSMEPMSAFSQDATGHEHRGKGEGGGQFTGDGGDTNTTTKKENWGDTMARKAAKNAEKARIATNKIPNIRLHPIPQPALPDDKMKQVIHRVLKEFGTTGAGVNWDRGECQQFAERVVKITGKHVKLQTELNSNGYYHSFVKAGTKYYDAETPDGVDDWKELPYFKHGPPVMSSFALSVNPEDHPRNASNQFIDKYTLAEVASDPSEAAALRESVPEGQRGKLDRAIAHLLGGGTIHHPSEPPGLGVDVSGDIADPAWAEYAHRLERYEEWADRDACRAGCRKCLDKAVELVRKGEVDVDLDEVDKLLKEASATTAETRALSRMRHRTEATDAASESLYDLYEDVIETIYRRIEADTKADTEPVEPEEPVESAALSTDAEGHQHKGTGPGGGQFTSSGGGTKKVAYGPNPGQGWVSGGKNKGGVNVWVYEGSSEGTIAAPSAPKAITPPQPKAENYGADDSVNAKSQQPPKSQHVLVPRVNSSEMIKSPVKNKRSLKGSVNVVEAVELENGIKGIFKPASGESTGDKSGPIRFNIPAGSSYKREAAASDIADILGFSDLVPKTVVRDIDNERGSLQQFVEDSDPAGALVGAGANIYDGDEDASRCAVFDYLICNTDRHFGNWMISKGGKIALIDNGLSMPTKHERRDIRSMLFAMRAAHKNLTMPDLSSWEGKWPEIESRLRELEIEDDAIVLTKQRFDSLVTASKRGGLITDLPSLTKKNAKLSDMRWLTLK